MQATVDKINGRPSDELRSEPRGEPGGGLPRELPGGLAEKRGCGGCGGQHTSSDIVRPTHPWPEDRRGIRSRAIDLVSLAAMNAIQHSRNFAYKVLSYWHARRLGFIEHELYHLRRLHCDACPRRKMDDKSGLEFCGADSCGCGKTKRACLSAKVRLAGWRCPIGRFGVRHQVAAPRDTRKVET